jgi:hypothetical protein
MKTLTTNQKTTIVIIGIVIAILLLVKIIGWNRVTGIFNSKKTEQIRLLKDKISSDSLKIVSLQIYLTQQKDSTDWYIKLYDQAKNNYRVVTRYYEQRINQVRGLPAKEAIAYFDLQTDCEDRWDTVILTRLSNISCANIKFIEREMFLSQRDTLQVMNSVLESKVSLYQGITLTQDDIIKLQKGSLDNFLNVVTTQDALVNDLQKEKKKVDKKIKRTKTMAIITGSAAIILGAILILQ